METHIAEEIIDGVTGLAPLPDDEYWFVKLGIDDDLYLHRVRKMVVRKIGWSGFWFKWREVRKNKTIAKKHIYTEFGGTPRPDNYIREDIIEESYKLSKQITPKRDMNERWVGAYPPKNINDVG